MRIVFMGTPEFALPCLNALEIAGQDIAAVFTQPDRPRGRGGKMQASPVKLWALERDIPVYTPARMRKEGVNDLRALAPDVCVTAAYGQILSQEILDIPKMGTVNVHASLLPKYRGAAPVNFALIHGETVTGVTTMLTDAGLDTGDMLLKVEVPITSEDNASTLLEKLANAGAPLLIETLSGLEAGTLKPIPQDDSKASYYPLLKKEDGLIDWTQDAKDIVNRVRGVYPWPGAYTTLPGGQLKVWDAEMTDGSGNPGEVIASDGKRGLIVACGDAAVHVKIMQAPGGKRMNSADYLRGKSIAMGSILGEDN